eukprot:CAMPEP_0179475380 /NCGR_PEP_ID=MMETSP0799-20121207/54592_1 /TAXON_ID=46947 /ORGANISM="Geminigera cryophila, Strain CCMP2564" /LENGTH=45 /DNA_ID= /DNA_START= /DNA_END= /DNA_ORIENTATION=
MGVLPRPFSAAPGSSLALGTSGSSELFPSSSPPPTSVVEASASSA